MHSNYAAGGIIRKARTESVCGGNTGCIYYLFYIAFALQEGNIFYLRAARVQAGYTWKKDKRSQQRRETAADAGPAAPWVPAAGAFTLGMGKARTRESGIWQR